MRETSEYFKRQRYIALDVDEEPAVDVVNKMAPITSALGGQALTSEHL